jgi:hypothetical protein
MKATGKLLLAALAVAATAVSIEVSAQDRSPRGTGGGGFNRGGGTPNWNGGHRWNGSPRGVHSGGRYWGGGYRGGGYRHSYWGPRVGLYFGAPLLFGSYYWGSPYYYDYWYPRSTVVYREVERYPQSFPEGVMSPAETTEVPRGEGAPTQGPLYMNYCESAKAYFPKVTKCPEGWRLATPAQ